MLVNITGGADLTLGEVHQINEIVHDAVGDDAEIIFGAVHEPAMQGEIRVTVIATGFDKVSQLPRPGRRDRVVAQGRARHSAAFAAQPGGRASQHRPAASRGADADIAPRRPAAAPPPERAEQDLSDMEIPTFIRRQMD